MSLLLLLGGGSAFSGRSASASGSLGLGGTATAEAVPRSPTTAAQRGLIVLRPKTIDEGVLASSNLAEADPGAWDAAVSYGEGDTVSKATRTTRALYRSAGDSNLGHDPATSPAWWALDGTTYAPWTSQVYLTGDRVIDAAGHHAYESQSGTAATVTLTLGTPGVVNQAAHGLVAGTPWLIETTGAVLTGLTPDTIVYVKDPVADAFNVSATPGGPAIAFSGTQSGVHTGIANPNLNRDPTDQVANGGFWLDLGPTNRWAMFDSTVGTASSHPYRIDVSAQLSGRVDALALIGMKDATSARVLVSTIADGLLYDQTFKLVSNYGITDWYSYFFNDIAKKPDLLVTGLPVYANPQVRVILEGNGVDPVSVGLLSIGLTKDLGETQHDGAQLGITDYSRKDVDVFGDYNLLERAFAKKESFKTRIPNHAVDGVFATLTEFRAKAAVFSASSDYSSTLIFAFIRQFTIDLDTALEALLSIDFEGLT